MTPKEKNETQPADTHICDEECQHEQFVIPVQSEDGSTQNYIPIGHIDYEDKQYIALVPEGEDTYDIYQMIGEGDIVTFYPIEDEELYDIIADKFNELFLSEMDKMGLLDEENFLNPEED
jgi:uncharacterized protein YrzB (UPF0473 family)